LTLHLINIKLCQSVRSSQLTKLYIEMGAGKSKTAYTSNARSILARRALEPDMKQNIRQSIPEPIEHLEQIPKVTVSKMNTVDIRENPIPARSGHVPGTQESARATMERINNYVPKEPPMNPDILKTMSQWQVVTSEVDESHIKLRNEGELMATVIRHQEESKIAAANYGTMPKTLMGKVTEEQMLKLMKSCLDIEYNKDNSNTNTNTNNLDITRIQRVANQYNLHEKNVEVLLKYARHAKVTQSPENPDLLIGR
jgi:hypothetical protein